MALKSFALVALVCCAACSRQPPAVSEPRRVASSVLVVTIDTLRADRLGIYGASNVETPNIDRLAREGAWAPQAEVHTPLTRPSHVSLFTGLYPAEHGIRDNVAPPLGPNVPLLASLFERDGFATAAFVSSVVLERQSGLARGFGLYSDRFEPGALQKRGDEVTAEAIRWLAGKRHFFAWVHLYDPHAPYQPPAPYAARYADRLYDGEVAWTDELVGRLVTALREAGTLDDTLVVVTSDHGEGLGEHGEDVHGYFVYESTLRVPLVMRGPGIKVGTRMAGVARSVDLFPTLFELAGLRGQAPASSGRSLAPALGGGEVSDEPSFAESLVPLLQFGWSDLRAVRDGRWKYILAPRPELYDLEKDPGELRNLVDAEPARARAMRAGLRARLETEQTAARGDTARAGVPPELLEKLGALGYVSPGGPSPTKTTGADPKDKIDEYKAISRLMTEGLVALREGRPAQTLERFQGLERRGVDGYELHFYRGRAYAALKRWREAAAEYERAAAKLPGDAAAWRGIGDSRVELRDWPAAVRAFQRVVSLVPVDAFARMQLGEAYRDAGDVQGATREMREAVKLDPAPASYWNALGTMIGAGGEMVEAEQAFANAVSRDSGNGLFLFNDAAALERLGRRDEAIAQYRRSDSLGYTLAARRLAELDRHGKSLAR